MDGLPIGPMLAVFVLLILWSGLFTAVEIAQQHLLAQRTASRASDKPLAKLSFPLDSLILCNTLCRALAVVITTLLAIFLCEENSLIVKTYRLLHIRLLAKLQSLPLLSF